MSRKALLKLLLALLAATFTAPAAYGQCTYENKAFKDSEKIYYNLYFNWKFIWLKAGQASLVTQPITYRGMQAYKTSLVTQTSKTIDKYFRMRDTILVHFSTKLTPLYYRKGAHEGKRYYVDEVWYTYPDGKCLTTQRHQTASGEVRSYKKMYNNCVSDMLNSFQRVRNLDAYKWKKGHTVHLDIAGGEQLQPAKLVYRGKKDVKGDDGKTYPSLVLSYIETEGGKDKEIVRFYVTDDQRHIPVRLDLYLKFGSAKAFLSGIK